MTQDTDTRNLPAVGADGKCTACGGDTFTLAKDYTAYSPNICLVGGKVDMENSYGHDEDSAAEDAVRFFCGNCGERHQVPEELLK